MIFNSLEFLIFFILLYPLYWFGTKNNLKLQNLLLLLGSYVFYAWSDWRLLSYLIASSIISFYAGIYIEKTTNPSQKQWFLTIGLVQGLGGLIFFKYFNFFITSFKDAFHQIGINLNISTLNLLVPIGISFFTFKTISYLLDVNKGKMTACKDWISFFTYVGFFPTILSGPIDRAKSFIPQLEKPRTFSYEKSINGFKQIVWGLFKKVVIADSLSVGVNDIFTNYPTFHFTSLIVGIIAYSFQLYADFSGYSDMAIGFSRLLGFEVTPNFNYPFLGENVADFWRRWHISLTSWLTEYVFTPLSITFRDYDKLGVILSITINFIICGFWHGPNWTFIVWGVLHGLYFIPLILSGSFNKKKKKVAKETTSQWIVRHLKIVGTFSLISLNLVLFRANTIAEAFGYYKQILVGLISFHFEVPKYLSSFYFILSFILLEYYLRKKDEITILKSLWLNKVFYAIIGFFIVLYLGQAESYIYFKF